MNRTLIDYTPESEVAAEVARDASIFSTSDEFELATEFLEVQNDRELDRFLGDLISRAGHAAGAAADAPIAQALTAALQPTARQALPAAGRIVGSRMFGLELEGLSPEDAEFEIARAFIRFASATMATALPAQRTASPPSVARSASARAATRYAPGLFRRASPPLSGRWFRRGRNIVVVNS